VGSHQGPQPQILTPAREVERFTESPKPLDPVSASHYNSRVLDITPKQPASPPLWFLLLVAALNGAAILILQIVGGKLLAPYLGSSHYVWTAQILVTMVALVVGYEFGGRMSDRQRSLTWLFGSMGAAAVWLALVLPFTEPIAFYALRWNLAIASLVAGGVLFFVPLLLLAITGPFLLRSLPVTQNNVGTPGGFAFRREHFGKRRRSLAGRFGSGAEPSERRGASSDCVGADLAQRRVLRRMEPWRAAGGGGDGGSAGGMLGRCAGNPRPDPERLSNTGRSLSVGIRPLG
jgi:hypothetical protein